MKHEYFFTDSNGKKQDAPLWEEWLGEDTADTWELSEDPPDPVRKFEVPKEPRRNFYERMTELLAKLRGKGGNPYHDEKGRFASGPGIRGGHKVYRVAPGDTPPEAIAARIKALGIPPAWTHLEIAMDDDSPVLARGRDAKGRVVSKRSVAASEEAAAEKFARLKQFHKARPGIMAKVEKDLTSKNKIIREHATALLLIDRTGFRPGSDRDTGAEKQAYGATTLMGRHLKVTGDKVTFKFVGKKGVTITKTLTDSLLASALRKPDEKGGQLFPNVSDASLRDYLKASGGGKFKVKDFRTWNGTAAALKKVKALPVPKTEAQLNKQRKLVAKHVSTVLGNTPTIALKSYIDPSVFTRWEKVA